MANTYADVVAGIVDVLEGVTGITQVLAYEPTAIHDFPTAYVLFDEAVGFASGQVRGMRYRILIRLCFRWQDQEEAELELMPFVDSVPAALAADRQLSGSITRGLVDMDSLEVVGGFTKIGSTLVRVLDFSIEAVVK